MELLFVLLHICLFLFVFRIAISLFQYRNTRVKASPISAQFKRVITGTFLVSFFGIFISEIILNSIQVTVSTLPAFLSKNATLPPLLSVLGICLCILSVIALYLSLHAMGKSMRFGLNKNNKGKLITQGIFSQSRNPFFVSILLLFFGIALLIPNVFFIACATSSLIAIHFYILKEEQFMRQHYGEEYVSYCQRVGRYF